jgi:hypothetical protein
MAALQEHIGAIQGEGLQIAQHAFEASLQEVRDRFHGSLLLAYRCQWAQ